MKLNEEASSNPFKTSSACITGTCMTDHYSSQTNQDLQDFGTVTFRILTS